MSRRQEFDEHLMPIPECGCWIWMGCIDKTTGYGRTTYEGKLIGTHRLSWIKRSGPIPAGLSVLHKCDTPSCVNPDHLFLGTFRDNMKDKLTKVRQARGRQFPIAKLSEEAVRKIRADGRLQRDIAAEYGVSVSSISAVKLGRRWGYV